MNINTIKYLSTVNGEGFRTAIFVSGCDLHCPGCFNKAAWDYRYGRPIDRCLEDKIMASVEPSYIKGLSILGGEPMSQKNQEGINDLLDTFRHRFGNGKTVWLWTGYYIENIPITNYTDKILNKLDVIVDGPFVDTLYRHDLQFRGSSNQHIIHLNH